WHPRPRGRLRPEADDDLAAATALRRLGRRAARRSRRAGPGGAARRARPDATGGGGPVSVPAARGNPQAVPATEQHPHLARWPVVPTGRGGGYGLRLTTAWRRRRPCGGLGGGRHGGRGGPGTAARPDGRGRTRREGGGPVSVPAARGNPQAVPATGQHPHLTGPPVGTPGQEGG